MERKLVIFSAPSGAGKTTIVHHLLDSELNLGFSISVASREIRSNETCGKDYYFISVDEFIKKIDEHEFLEWQEVYENHYYGSLKKEVNRIWNEGKHVIFDVDVVGGLNIKNYYNELALAVFVMPPSVEELEKRLRARSTESEKNLRKRLEKAKREMTYAERFDVILMNDDLNKSKIEAVELVNNFLNS